MFERTRLTLTAWYLVIIMTISILFSFVIFSMVNVEYHRFEGLRAFVNDDIKYTAPPLPAQTTFMPKQRINPTFIEDSRKRLIENLFLTNLAIFFFAGGLGYLLAGRTLRPIKDMVEEQNRFISDSSHELRTPLTSLRSEIEVALRNKATSEQTKKILRSNLEEVLRLQTLSDSLLELAQNGEFINPNNLTPVSLNQIITLSMKRVESMAKKKNIKIEENNNKKKIQIIGDQERLTELFIILLDNAIKYSPLKSKVEVITNVKNKEVEVMVKDHGNGISQDDIPYVFDRFFRADKSRKQSGYGLGLSIAKKIVESHEGSIIVKSKPDKETVFIVTLPKS